QVLSAGKAADKVAALQEVAQPLLRQAEKEAADAGTAKDAVKLAAAERKGRLVSRLLASVLETHTLLDRHVNTDTDEGEDRLGERIKALDKDTEANLAALASPPPDEEERPLVDKATAAVGDFRAAVGQALKFSRLNTNSKGAALALGPEFKALTQCTDVV